jgi:hypothetical protein
MNERSDNSENVNSGDKQTLQSAIVPPPNPPDATSARQNEKKSFCEKWHHEIEFVAVLAAVIYAVFTWMEWKTFDSERMTMEQEFRTGQTNALQQLRVFQDQLEEMKQARMEDERAWVFVTIPNNALDVSSTNAVITIMDKNVGKTPAVIMSTFGSMAIDSKRIPLHDPPGSSTSLMLVPNQEAKVMINLPEVVKQGILLNIKIFIYGTVCYRDINQKTHWTQFCFSFSQNGAYMQPENFHNACDDLEVNAQN